VEAEFRLQIDLYGQLVAAVPHAQHLARLHHLLDIEQGGQGSASGVDHNGQGRVLADAQQLAGILEKYERQFGPHLLAQEVLVRRVLQPAWQIYEAGHKIGNLVLVAHSELLKIQPCIADGLALRVQPIGDELHKAHTVQPELY